MRHRKAFLDIVKNILVSNDQLVMSTKMGLLFSLFFFLFFCQGVHAGLEDACKNPANAFDEKLFVICHYTLDAQYEKAIQHGRELVAEYPREPLAHFFLSTVYMYMLRSYWDYPIDDQYYRIKEIFERVSEQAIEVCDQADEQTSDVYFCRGAILGTMALVNLQNSEWLNAYSRGKKGVAELKIALELNPENYDAYLGLGMFEYYCAALKGTTKILAWIVGFRGDKDKGISYIRTAMEKGRYSVGPGHVFFAAANIMYEGKPLTGLQLAEQLIAEYPHNGQYYDYVCRAARRLPAEHIDFGIRTIQRITAETDWNKEIYSIIHFDPDLVLYELAVLHERSQNYDESREILEKLAIREGKWDELTSRINLHLLEIYHTSGDDTEALSIYNRILSKEPIQKSHKKAKQIVRN